MEKEKKILAYRKYILDIPEIAAVVINSMPHILTQHTRRLAHHMWDSSK